MNCQMLSLKQILRPRGQTMVGVLAAVLTLVVLASCSRKDSSEVKPANVDYYTCAMHPSVRSQKPHDHCPICSMGLVPVYKETKGGNENNSTNQDLAAMETNDDRPREFTVPLERQQQIGVTFAIITNKTVHQTIRTVGVVAADKQRHWDYVARVDGYVKKLFVFSPGEPVEKGAPLLTIYSPDLLTSENEFLDLLRTRDAAQTNGSQALRENTDQLMASARERLRLWNISDDQITNLETTRRPVEELTLNSPFKGVVQTIAVDQGRKVAPGDHLVDVADLSMVWVWAQFYQEDIPLLQNGLEVAITSATYPGETFKAKISVIDPFLNDNLRSARVRMEVENSQLKLRPDMYVDAELTVDMGEKLVVPTVAVLPTGRHDIVFIDKGGGRLEPRYVELGRKFGDDFEVKSGLKEGERVVASANFLIDAEAQVQGALKSW